MLLSWFLRHFLHQCLRIGLALGLGLLAWSAQAQDGLQPVPELSAHAMDLSGTLDAPQLKALDDKLAAFEAAHGSQVVVLVLHSTAPEDIASYANRVGNAWNIGRKEVGDGLLLVVAKDDHKLRIEVAKSLEGAIPDLAAKRVIDQDITPRFKQGDFAGGLDAGVDKIMALILHEALPDPAEAPEAADNLGELIFWVAVVDFVTLWLLLAFGGQAGAIAAVYGSFSSAVFGLAGWYVFSDTSLAFWTAMAGMVVGLISIAVKSVSGAPSSRAVNTSRSSSGSSSSWSSSWSSSDSSSSSSDSSFSSGGGGDFGGGGASGDW
ncbi:MAG: TPM domain-containing protein [Rhodoferax sp.]|nr:TPM domain-containing protein [Rhodoferax sp.]